MIDELTRLRLKKIFIKYYAEEKLKEALEVLKTLLEVTPNDDMLHFHMYNICTKLNMHEQAKIAKSNMEALREDL